MGTFPTGLLDFDGDIGPAPTLFRLRDRIREYGYEGDIWFGMVEHKGEPAIVVTVNGNDHFMPFGLSEPDQDAWVRKLLVN